MFKFLGIDELSLLYFNLSFLSTVNILSQRQCTMEKEIKNNSPGVPHPSPTHTSSDVQTDGWLLTRVASRLDPDPRKLRRFADLFLKFCFNSSSKDLTYAASAVLSRFLIISRHLGSI